jgi:uncharacterized protein YggU (UPF0235/DUF167 family)
MKIFVKAKPGANEDKVDPPAARLWQENKNDGAGEKEWFKVSVKEPPTQGRANTAIGKLLAQHFKVSPSQIRLISGFSSKQKVFEIQ